MGPGSVVTFVTGSKNDFTAETQRRRVKKEKSENAEGAEVTVGKEGSLKWFTRRFKPFVKTGSLKLIRSPTFLPESFR
jgi:hypothetical protein